MQHRLAGANRGTNTAEQAAGYGRAFDAKGQSAVARWARSLMASAARIFSISMVEHQRRAEAISPGNLAELRQSPQILDQLLDGLDEQNRIAVLLCDVSGLSVQEIAEITNASVGKVRLRITRGREQLNRAYEILQAIRDEQELDDAIAALDSYDRTSGAQGPSVEGV
jgi:RNA polymerase sigma factor (sigma-70 family)